MMVSLDQRPQGGETLCAGCRLARLDVAVVSDIALIRCGLQAMLKSFSDRVRVSGRPLRAVRRTRADVTVLHPGQEMLAAMSLLADPGNGRVLLYACNLSPDQVGRVLAGGCAGYVDYRVRADVLMEAVESAAEGYPGPGVSPQQAWPGPGHGLSPREAEVIGLIGHGLTNQDIADRMYLSVNTVKTYIRSAYHKIGVTRRVEAIRWSIEHDIPAAPERRAG